MTAAAVPVLREVRLYGRLGREFGRVFRLAVATPAEAVQALRAVLPGFERALLGPGGRAAYHVLVGRGEARRDLGEADLVAPVAAAEPIRLVPVIEGAKRQGLGQTILGATLIFLSWGIGGGLGPVGRMLVQAGTILVLGGVIGAVTGPLSPPPRITTVAGRTPGTPPSWPARAPTRARCMPPSWTSGSTCARATCSGPTAGWRRC